MSVVCQTEPGETESTVILPDAACGGTQIQEMAFVVKEENERISKEEPEEQAICTSPIPGECCWLYVIIIVS